MGKFKCENEAHAGFVLLILLFICCTHTFLVSAAPSSTTSMKDTCGHTLHRPTSFFKRHFDYSFLKKFFKHLIPFTQSSRAKMQFFLYKHDFPECGRELFTDEDELLDMSGFDAKHPTRIIIHGWMSQSKGSLNRAVKNAYLSLTMPRESHDDIKINISSSSSTSNETLSGDLSDFPREATTREETTETTESTDSNAPTQRHNDFNIIVCDWSVISSNVNYFTVVELIEDLGFQLAEFLRHLHMSAGLQFDDVYLIGHSLGAQIAGSAGKQVQPFLINTIYALDPAGPKFRTLSDEYRLDPTDARYVESIQTSVGLGFEEPVGHATFYPNFGKDQKKCYIYGCSHSRAYNYFAESIVSDKGFWGTLCQRESEDVWILSQSGAEFRMGGEPSLPKRGTFYVKTNDKPPYAMGKRQRAIEGNSEDIVEQDESEKIEIEVVALRNEYEI